MAKKIEVKINPNFTCGGVAGSFTWQRLEKILRKAGELHDNEVINGYNIDEQGVNFYIDTKK